MKPYSWNVLYCMKKISQISSKATVNAHCIGCRGSVHLDSIFFTLWPNNPYEDLSHKAFVDSWWKSSIEFIIFTMLLHDAAVRKGLKKYSGALTWFRRQGSRYAPIVLIIDIEKPKENFAKNMSFFNAIQRPDRCCFLFVCFVPAAPAQPGKRACCRL
jgi:hypothetical protein